jgi:FkbM family methyltransferase
MRSLTSAAMAVVDVGGRRVFGSQRWRMAPWYAARLGQMLGRPIRVDGAVIQLHDPQAMMLEGVLRLHRYEEGERYAVAKFLPRDQSVIELGAGLGVVTSLINRLLERRAEHWVVEANPTLLPVLNATRQRNHAEFQVVHGALAYGSETVEFGIDPDVLESAVRDAQRATVTVRALTFADLLERTGLRLGSLVCDIEGAEAELIRREGSLVARHIQTIVMEVHPHLLGADGVRELHTSLEALGYASVWKHDQVWVMKRSLESPGSTSGSPPS